MLYPPHWSHKEPSVFDWSEIYEHTDESNYEPGKLTQILIVITFFQLIWHQTDNSWFQINRKSVITIQIGIHPTRFRIYSRNSRRGSVAFVAHLGNHRLRWRFCLKKKLPQGHEDSEMCLVLKLDNGKVVSIADE